MTNVLPFPAPVPRKPTPLADSINSLKFSFKVQSGGTEATHIFLPKKALRSEVRPFIDALCAEVDDIGNAPRVFDRIVNSDTPQCSFCDLVIQMYDGQTVIVGTAEMLDG